MTAHTEACQRRLNDNNAERNAWAQKWPNHCKVCEGAGVQQWYESVPYGSTTASMPCSELCDCLAGGAFDQLGKCPRCVAAIFTNGMLEADAPCPTCGWNWGKGKDDLMPSAYECWHECIREENEYYDRKAEMYP